MEESGEVWWFERAEELWPDLRHPYLGHTTLDDNDNTGTRNNHHISNSWVSGAEYLYTSFGITSRGEEEKVGEMGPLSRCHVVVVGSARAEKMIYKFNLLVACWKKNLFAAAAEERRVKLWIHLQVRASRAQQAKIIIIRGWWSYKFTGGKNAKPKDDLFSTIAMKIILGRGKSVICPH